MAASTADATRIPVPTRWLTHGVSVAVVGAGGTGSQVVDQLASLNATLKALGHPGFEVTVYDPDVVSASNIGRQRFCSADIGLHKSDVLVHRVNLFHGLRWRSRPVHFQRGNYDLVIGCVDTVAARDAIYESGCNYWLDCGNGPTGGHVILGMLPPSFCFYRDDSAFLLPTWRDLFADVEEEEEDAPSCSVEEAIQRQSWPVNHRAAQIACELLYCWLRNGAIDWHGALFTVDPPSISLLSLRAETWWPFGLEVSPESVKDLAVSRA